MKPRLLCSASLSLVLVCLIAAYQSSASSAQNKPRAAGPEDARYTIAFKSFAPNNSDIFLADADGTRIRPLVPDPALDYNASFSADGHWIVFTSHRAGSADIWRVHPDGNGLQRLTDDLEIKPLCRPTADSWPLSQAAAARQTFGFST